MLHFLNAPIEQPRSRFDGVLRLAQMGSLAALLAVSGCATVSPATTHNTVSTRPAATPVGGAADWAWHVSGDAVVRPVQVFSLGDQTYFEMRAGQRIPAVFANGQPVPFRIAPPYIVVTGHYARYDLMIDGYSATVMHDGPVPLPAPVAPAGPNRLHRVNVGMTSASGSYSAAYASAGSRPVPRSAPADGAVIAPPIPRTPEAPASRVWRIDPEQGTLSSALRDWCDRVGVRLVWRANVDLPIERGAVYREPKFFAAMTKLLADASASNYQFFYSVTGNTVTVISVKRS